jgi:hypothetical protein
VLLCQDESVGESWDERVDRFWTSADDSRPESMLAAMRHLVEERPAGDPDAVYEWASVHDFLGLEAAAVPLYEQALAGGLAGGRRSQAIIQLASSLRNLGETRAAIDLLEGVEPDAGTGSAARAFLALALYDDGRPDAALRVALRALAPTLPLYSRAVTSYADELTRPSAR